MAPNTKKLMQFSRFNDTPFPDSIEVYVRRNKNTILKISV